MKTADLTGALLDYWTARAEGVPADQLEIREVPRTDWKICVRNGMKVLDYSTSWVLTGPLVEKHRIDLTESHGCWSAYDGANGLDHGGTPLIAICRAVVRAAFGDEVEDLP